MRSPCLEVLCPMRSPYLEVPCISTQCRPLSSILRSDTCSASLRASQSTFEMAHCTSSSTPCSLPPFQEFLSLLSTNLSQAFEQKANKTLAVEPTFTGDYLKEFKGNMTSEIPAESGIFRLNRIRSSWLTKMGEARPANNYGFGIGEERSGAVVSDGKSRVGTVGDGSGFTLLGRIPGTGSGSVGLGYTVLGEDSGKGGVALFGTTDVQGGRGTLRNDEPVEFGKGVFPRISGGV